MTTRGKVNGLLIPTADARGIVLIVALLVMVFLTALGATFLTISLTESQISSNAVDSTKAFNMAEAGLERAKRTLKMSTASSLNVFLAGTAPGPYPFGNAPVAGNSLDGGNYIVRVYDNNDGDANLNTDADDVVFVEVTGTYRNARRQVVAMLTVPLVPAPIGSVHAIAPAGEVEVELEKGSALDGNDWNPPANIAACTTIVTCGTNLTAIDSVANPAIAGVASSALDIDIEVKPPSTLTGSPPTQFDPSISATPWDNLANQLIPLANRTLNIPENLTGTHTWGTPSAPEITVINAIDIKIQTGAVVNGAGVLIINNLGELELDHGIFNWQGLILIRGTGELEVEFEGDNDSTARIFGGLIMRTTCCDPEIELEIENVNAFIKFSRSAMNMVRDFLPVTLQNWREVPLS